MDRGSVTEHDGDAFCKPCYGKLFGPKGYGFAGGSAGLSANDTENSRPQKLVAILLSYKTDPTLNVEINSIVVLLCSEIVWQLLAKLLTGVGNYFWFES